MWVFIQRVGDQYIGEAYGDDGTTLVERTAPKGKVELAQLIMSLDPDGDSLDFDCAIYDADERDAELNDAWRTYFLLRVRARAGKASQEDGQWVIDQLQRSDSPFARHLLHTLGELGREYEEVAAGFLYGPNTGGRCEDAMSALVDMGLANKYAPVLARWMTGSPPQPPARIGSLVYGIASHALRTTGNPQILRAFIEACKDRRERWTSREHAFSCLAAAIDLDNAPLGTRMSPDHPYMQSVLARAERMLAEHEGA